MKKIILIMTLSIFMLSACISNISGDGNVDQNIEELESNVTLNVKWSGESETLSTSKFIHYDTTEIQVVLTKGDLKERVTFVRESDETEVSKTLKNIETGIWTVNVALDDSSGEIATKQETVIIVEGTNEITIVMDRGNYSNNPKLWEAFYPNYEYNYLGSFFGIHAVAALGIETIEITLTDKLGEYETFLPVNMYLPHFDDDTDSNWLASGTGVVGTLTFTYDSDDQITQAVYSNDSNYISTTTFTYDSVGELTTEQTVVTYNGTEQSNITKTFAYEDGLLSAVNSDDGEVISISYSDGKLSTFSISENSVIVYSESYSLSGDEISRINYDIVTDKYETFTIDISTSGELHSNVNTYTSSSSPSAFASASYYDETKIEYSFSLVNEGEKIVFNTTNSQIDTVGLYSTSYSSDTQVASLNISYKTTVIDI